MTGPRRLPARDPVRADHDGRRAMLVLPREITAAATARAWLGVFVDEHGGSEERRRDAVLVISELVTNALRHGLGDVVARASIGQGGRLDLAVTDSGNELPSVLPADPQRIGGVGLLVVQQLAGEWGATPFPGGKTVWATLPSVVPA